MRQRQLLVHCIIAVAVAVGFSGCMDSDQVPQNPVEPSLPPLVVPEMVPLPDFVEPGLDVPALVARLKAAVNATTACGTNHMQIPDWQWEMAPLMPPGRIGFNQCVDAAIARQANYDSMTPAQRDREFARLDAKGRELEEQAIVMLNVPPTFESIVDAQVVGASMLSIAVAIDSINAKRERQAEPGTQPSGSNVANLWSSVSRLHWQIQFHEAFGPRQGTHCTFKSSIAGAFDDAIAALEVQAQEPPLEASANNQQRWLHHAHWIRELGSEEGMRYMLAFLEQSLAYRNTTLPDGEITKEYMIAVLHNRHAEHRTLQRGHMVVGDMTYFMTGEFGSSFFPDRYRKAMALDHVGWHFEELLECT